MTRPLRILDLYCCGGGAARGYAQAGFDVVGVDIKVQPQYPYEFHQGDAVEFLLAHGQDFDLIHASPPCQGYSSHVTGKGRHAGTADRWKEILGITAHEPMTQHQLRECIPPAYTRFLGAQAFLLLAGAANEQLPLLEAA